MRRAVALLIFLLFVDDNGATYAKHLAAPFGWVQPILFEPLPIKLRPFDLAMFVLLFAASAKGEVRGARVRPMRNALFLAAGTIVAWFAYGMLRGGDARAASWQVYLPLSAVLVAFTVAATFETPAHFALLGKTVVVAAVYRAVMCWLFYFMDVRTMTIHPFPEFLTTHEDTVLWVTAILIVVVHALEQRKTRVTLRAALLTLLFVGAIQWNARRLAWVSLVMGFGAVFFLLPPGAVRRRVKRLAIAAAPIAALYVAIGWGRSERIFRPLHAFATVSTREDASTKARDVEDLGLIFTAHTAGVLGGTGWGRKYIALSNKYSIAEYFELWPYIPHNSILGLLAYTGILGMAGYWLAFPTGVFLNARVARLAPNTAARTAAIIGAAQMIVCANQMYGDMGIFSPKTMYVLAGSYAMAMRLPAVAGVWGAQPPAVRPPSNS